MIISISHYNQVDRVWARCGGGADSRLGVAVICWGCGVWHRSVPALCQVDVFYFDIYRYLNLTDTKYFFPFTSGKMEIWTRGPTDELLM